MGEVKKEAGILIPFRKGNKWGYCDENKNIVIQPVYDTPCIFSEGIALVQLSS